ncbi:uncharacterized protein LOC119557813 [Drosophila subpulchrella]|uniref:uncharacterized protein LOC119557813 n=1 Tax=Drosophila subpulchrella TaxID=1486046 RepID=UPI0018A1A3D4|nr:uncharacterized protein LOC119557813 [Drosophila subpulchrella]
MSKAQHLMARDQLAAIAQEEARRKRAEMRRSYGNKFSSINLIKMRQKQGTSGDTVGAKAAITKPPPLETKTVSSPPPPSLPKDKDKSLRRIASSFAHVRDLVNGSCAALPLEDSDEDAREERAEVLINSQTMPLPPLCDSLMSVDPPEEPVVPVEPPSETVSQLGTVQLAKLMPDPLHIESRAIERWRQVGSTVSALFRARRYVDGSETPVAQIRRLREQRELLEAFTRPFLYESYKK